MRKKKKIKQTKNFIKFPSKSRNYTWGKVLCLFFVSPSLSRVKKFEKFFFRRNLTRNLRSLVYNAEKVLVLSLSRNVSFISSASSRPKITSKKYEYCQLPAIPVIINCDQLLVATWQHHPLESHAIDSNDLVRKFPDTWGVPMSRPVMKEHFITQITQKDDGKSLI